MKNQDLNDFAIEGAGGGGGCFVAGTQIYTPDGNKNIEDIKVGDKVFCYEEGSIHGELVVGEVYSTSKHPQQDNNARLYTFYVDGEIVVQATGNHAFMTSTGAFEYAGNFEPGDILTHWTGEHFIITQVDARDVKPDEFVYNFEVNPHHTYIANGLRVHNGGGGSKKSKGGGSARAAVESPNTLSSSASALIVEVLSEGEVVGLVNGAKSIYLDGTPVQNSDGTYNYANFSFDERKGLPTQNYMPGFPDVESEVNVNVDVTPTISVSRVTTNANVDGIRITVQLPQGLFVQNKSNGDITGHSVQLAIDTRPSGGTWTQVLYPAISGKSMTPYEETWRVNRPNTGPGLWEIRVRRVSAADPDSSSRSTTTFTHFTEIIDKKLTYPNTAYVGIKVDAKSTGGSIPKRSFHIKGVKIQVPSNYNPTTRVYTGTWNGTFTTAWTDNPAWITYDLLTNDRYGMGGFIEPSMIDKYSFYDAARYNDELVPNGDGTGAEPRFTFNAVMNTRQDAWKLIQAVASSCRSVVYYGGGLIKLIQDRPTSTSLIVNKTDVADGLFEYSSTSMQQRHTAIQVSYNDKNDRYLPATVSVEDAPGIARYGYNTKETMAYGATTAGQARRLGLWALYTELGTTESIKFVCGMNLATRISPGSVIKVVDEELMGVPFGGRIISGTTSSITLDRPVQLLNGQTYTIEWVDDDGVSLHARTISNTAGTYTTINCAPINVTLYGTPDSAGLTGSPLVEGELIQFTSITTTTGISINTPYYVRNASPSSFQLSLTPTGSIINLVNNGSGVIQIITPTIGRSWVITGSITEGRLWRIYTVKETANTAFEVTGYRYLPAKYTEVDNATNPDLWTPVNKILNVCKSPTNVRWVRETTTDSYGRRVVNLRINWDQEDEQYISTYQVAYRRDGRMATNTMLTTHKEFVIPNVDAGTYEAYIYAVNISNVQSLMTFSSFFNDLSGGISGLLPVLNLSVKGGGLTWTGKDLTFTWEQNPANQNIGESVFKAYYVEIANHATNEVLRTAEIQDTEYTYYFDDNKVDFAGVPSRDIEVRVYNKDSLNRTSAATEQTFNNPVPAAPSFTLMGGYQYYSVIISNPDTVDTAGYYVAQVTNPTDNPISTNVVYKGPNTRIDIGYYDPVDVVVRVAAYDVFNPDFSTLVWATGQTATITQAQAIVDSTEGYKFFSLLFKQNDPSANHISWTASTVAKTNTSPVQTQNCPAGNATWSGSALYLYYDWSTNTIQGTTTLANAVGVNKAVIATYYGGKTLNQANGDAYFDGNKIIAQTISASQIIAGTITANEIASATITAGNLRADTAIITNALQVQSGLINGTHIQDGAITATEIAANTIAAGNLRTDTAVITTAAQIQDAVISTAKIGDLQVTSLKIGDNAVTSTAYYDYSTPISFSPNNGVYQVMDTITFTGTGNKHLIQTNIGHSVSDGLDFGSTAWGPPTKDYYYVSQALFKCEITHGTVPSVVYDLTDFIPIGQSYGTMHQVTDNSGTVRWLNGGYYKAGQLNGESLPIRTYPQMGTTNTHSIMFPTVNGRVYTMTWYIRIDRTVKSVDNTTTYNPTASGSVNKRLYAITEIKK